MVADSSAKRTKKRIALCYPLCVERKTRLAHTRSVGGFSRTISTPPTPGRGVLWSLGQNLIILKTKRLAFSQPFDFERKTRLELATPTLARLCSTN